MKIACVLAMGLVMWFTMLKLTAVISMSWWWVTAPFWVPFAILNLLCLYVGWMGFMEEMMIRREEER